MTIKVRYQTCPECNFANSPDAQHCEHCAYGFPPEFASPIQSDNTGGMIFCQYCGKVLHGGCDNPWCPKTATLIATPEIVSDGRKFDNYGGSKPELITFEEVESLRRQNERLRGEIEALKKAAASPEIPFRLYREINASEIISMYLSEIREATLCPLLQAHNVQVHVYDCEQDYWHEGWRDQAVYRIMIKERP